MNKPPVVELGAPQVAADEAMPAIELEPGQNLFGDVIGTQVEEAGVRAVSQNQKRIKGMITRTPEIANKQDDLNSKSKQLAGQIAEKSTIYSQLRNRCESAIGQLILANEKMVYLSAALSLPRNNPQVQEYYRNKTMAQTLAAEIKLMEHQDKTLPVEIRNLNAEQMALEKQQFAIDQDMSTLFAGWSEILSIFAIIPTYDAEAIVKSCQVELDQYPSAYPVLMMQAFARLQLSQSQAAKVDLTKVYQATRGRNDKLIKAFRLRCLVGLAWAELQLGQLDAASAKLAEARDIHVSDYEVAVCEGHLLHLRGKDKAAFTAYKRATTLGPKRTEGFRMAAEMVAETKTRPPAVALLLAQKACELDEFGDFRNSLSLARAQFANGQQQACQESIAKAYEQAGNDFKSIVAALEKELATPPIAVSDENPNSKVPVAQRP